MEDVIVCSGNMVSVDGVPKEIKILPLGNVHSQKGNFIVDDESVESIMQYFKERKLELVIDYEHQTLKDIQAPAGGWISDIRKGEDAIIATVKWTDRAAEYLKNKEYKYLSPVVMVSKKNRRAREIHSVALTNTPAIDGMFALVNSIDISNKNKEESKMELKELAKLLGLPEEATEADVRAALQKAGETKEEEPKKQKEETEKNNADGATEPVANSNSVSDPVVLSLLGLKKDAKTEDVAAAVMALKAGGSEAKELMALKEEMKKRNVQDLVQKALKDGKITASQTEWAQAYALSDKYGFEAFLEKAPVVVPQGKLDLKDAPKKHEECDMQILKNCGLSEEDIQKYYKKED